MDESTRPTTEAGRPREIVVHAGSVWHATGKVGVREGRLVAEFERRSQGEPTGATLWATWDGRSIVTAGE